MQEQHGIELSGLLDALAAPAPSPAGGTAAAVVAAMAASLVVMVGRGSAGWPSGPAAAIDAAALRERLLALGAEDVLAFGALLTVSRASREPGSGRESGGESGSAGLTDAIVRASEVPLEIAQCAADVVELAARAASDGRRSLRPDAEAAAILAEAATHAASLLVGVNLAALPAEERSNEHVRLVEAADATRERARRARVDR